MGQLHEVLAAEKARTLNADTITRETTKLFSDPKIYENENINYTPIFDEENNALHGNRTAVHPPLPLKVDDRLDYLSKALIKQFDLLVEKEVTNTEASAELIIGNICFQKVPVGVLIALEGRLRRLIDGTLAHIPTIDINKQWEEKTPDGFHFSKVVESYSNEDYDHFEPMGGNDKHPPQIVKTIEKRAVGKYEKQIRSGKITSHEKAQIIQRANEIYEAIVRARQIANRQEVNTQFSGSGGIATELFEYILK